MNIKPIKTVEDALNNGSVVLEYELQRGCWLGVDLERNRYTVTSIQFGDGLPWESAYYYGRWFRVCEKNELKQYGAEVIRAVNVGDTRN